MKTLVIVQASCPLCQGRGVRLTEGEPQRDGTVRFRFEACECARVVVLPQVPVESWGAPT